MHKNRPFFARLSFALRGLQITWARESSFRTHVAIAALVLVTAAIVRPAPVWWALLVLVIGVVICAELFNTSLENLADHVQPELDEEIRTVKDVAAAAVLVATMTAIAVGAAFAVDAFL